jgi:hypothetical protein
MEFKENGYPRENLRWLKDDHLAATKASSISASPAQKGQAPSDAAADRNEKT